jgi:DNA-binding winged helix-turn-helix (wHTH) protein/tetratricopeptide (TPR) repeat protein
MSFGECYDSSRIAGDGVMDAGVGSGNLFRFGTFEADSTEGTLTRGGIRVKIQEQPFRLLLLLLERPGEIVSREELKQGLWPEGTYVDFDGSLNVILKRLRASIDDDPENPRFIATVPRRGYRFIAPVSTASRVPQNSFTTVASLPLPAAKSEPLLSPRASPSQSLPPQQSRGYILYLYAGSVVALVVLGIIGWQLRSRFLTQPLTHNSPPVQMRKSVAVLGFSDLSGRSDDLWLATALSEMLSTELAAGEKLRLISGEDIANVRSSSPWKNTDTLDRTTTSRIGNALNSDVLVLGSYMSIGTGDRSQLRVDVRLQDARTGEILTEVAEVGNAQELFHLVSRIGNKLRDRLGVGDLQDSDQAAVLASLPLDPEAARLYALGIAKLRKFDALAAKDLLQQAANADPKFSLVHSMLATAWAQLGYEEKRKEEAKKALELSLDLPRPQRMLVEAEYYESIGQLEQAASTYHALFELFPDNVDYGLRLVSLQGRLGEGSQAMLIIQQLRKLPAPSSDDPRIDLAESRSMKDNKPAALVLIRNAISKASSRQENLLYAVARKEECMVILYGERPAEALPSCEEAYNIFVAAGNRVGAADAMRLMADMLGAQGHYEQAIAAYSRALAVLTGLGEHEKTGAILNNMAINFANEGNLDRAESLYREAKTHFDVAGDKAGALAAMVNIADILFARGNLPAAAKLYQETLDVTATIEHGEPGYSLYRMADLQLAEGNVKRAKQLAQEAIDSMRPTEGAYQYLSGAVVELGASMEAEGDLSDARQQFQQALEMRQKIGALELVAESQVELAGVAIEDGHPDQAESLLRSALGEFDKEKSDPDSSSAYVLLSRSLLMQGKLREAREASKRAIDLSLTSSDPSLKLPAEIQQARVEIAGNDASSNTAALKKLQSVVTTAKKLGYYNIEVQARLATGEFQLKTNSSLGQKQLKSLASESRSHGLGLLARQAESAIGNATVVAQDTNH